MEQFFFDNVFGNLKKSMLFIYLIIRYSTIFHREESSHKNRKKLQMTTVLPFLTVVEIQAIVIGNENEMR